MKTNTTVLLAVVLGGLVLGFFALQASPPSQSDALTPLSRQTADTTQDLITDKLGDVVKVSVVKKGHQPWLFEKKSREGEAGTAKWRMTSPFDVKVVSWEVDRFGRELGRLQYELSYEPGQEGALSAADAGLEPPQATVTLTDADGKTVTVEIGNAASQRETYVRLAGTGVICVGQSNLRTLFKSTPIEYRDRQVWNFSPEHAVRVEIEDRSSETAPTSYVFAKDGSRWMIEAPVSARGTEKIAEMVTTISRLRVAKWHEDAKDRLAVYGLEPAALTIRVTVEEPAIVADDDDADSPPAPPTIVVYEFHVADRTPIGEVTQTYARVGEESVVATISKVVADKLRPNLSQWREMRITTADVDRATRIELTVEGASTTLVKKDDDWTFEGDGGAAEAVQATALLTAVKNLEAVVFVEVSSGDVSSFGLTPPRAEVRLTVPGVEGAERIAVGGYTDESTKRMVYVRRNDLMSIAKVRVATVEALLRSPSDYRDRTIFAIPAGTVQSVSLTASNRFTEDRVGLAFEREGDGWRMTVPVTAAVRSGRLDSLVKVLSSLRAEAIAADSGEATAYGLHAPTVSVKLTTETEESFDLSVTEHEGSYYAMRSGLPSIYAVDQSFYDRLFEEFRSEKVLAFDDTEVTRFSIRRGAQTHTFVREGEGWTYAAETDLPLDAAKVDNLLLQIRDLKTNRFVVHNGSETVAYGLGAPEYEVTVSIDGADPQVLLVSPRKSHVATEPGYFASTKGQPGVYLLTADTLERIAVDLDTLEAR